MNDITQGLLAALRLIVTFDAELWEISLRSLQVSLTAVIIASAGCNAFWRFPCGATVQVPTACYFNNECVDGIAAGRCWLDLLHPFVPLRPLWCLRFVVHAMGHDHCPNCYYLLQLSHQFRTKRCANFGRNTMTFLSR